MDGEDAEEAAAPAPQPQPLRPKMFEEDRHRRRRRDDEKEKILIPGRAAEAHYFALLRTTTEDWQVWPDSPGPDPAAKCGQVRHNQRSLAQDLRDRVRERPALQPERAKAGDHDEDDDQ